MDWSLYIVWDRSEYIVLAGLELTEVHFSQIFRFGPFLPVAAVFSGRLDILGRVSSCCYMNSNSPDTPFSDPLPDREDQPQAPGEKGR